MRRSVAEMIVRDPEKYAHHDRVFLNNPVVMQGMGLAPLVVLATTGKNALMLAVSVALLLTPSRMLACLLSRAFPLRADDQVLVRRSKYTTKLVRLTEKSFCEIFAKKMLPGGFDDEK